LRRPGRVYVGNLKGVERIYQQTFIDSYAKVARAKLYDRKTPITAGGKYDKTRMRRSIRQTRRNKYARFDMARPGGRMVRVI
jgi:hypothetical protein